MAIRRLTPEEMAHLEWREQVQESQKQQLQDKITRFGNDAKIALIVVGFDALLWLIWVLATRSVDIFFWILAALVTISLGLYVVSVWRMFLAERQLLKLEQATRKPSLDD